MFSTHRLCAAAFATCVAAPALSASFGSVPAVGYSLGDNGSTLVRMSNLATPGMLTGAPITSASGDPVTLSALAYRPETGGFFGYSDADDTVYSVDVSTGVATRAASAMGATDVPTVGFDFNNVLDAARLVSTADDNLVFFPNNMPSNVVRVTPLAYAAGDVNEGADPSIFANAYTNAVPSPASTLQYALDSDLDSLATLANNSGVLSTVGALTVDGAPLDFTAEGGFDILSSAEGDNAAFALLTTALGTGLYSVTLSADMNGAVPASLIGMVGGEFGVLDGLAVAPAPIPIPASALLLLSGLGGVAALARRKARR